MEPAWTQFESAYKTKVDLVMMNVDEKTSPEMKKYGAFVQKSGSIPLTVWLDSKGQALDEKVGGMSEQELAEHTNAAMKKAH